MLSVLKLKPSTNNVRKKNQKKNKVEVGQCLTDIQGQQRGVSTSTNGNLISLDFLLTGLFAC